MKHSYINTHQDFLYNYLYNKLSHQYKSQFNLNFTDISLDLSEYIETTYSEYIRVDKVSRYNLYVPEETIMHLNALGRDYIKFYTWLKRDDLLSKLKEKCAYYNANYVLSDAKRRWLKDNGLSDSVIDKIGNAYEEWKAIRGYKTSKNTINYNVHTYLNTISNNNVITINAYNKALDFSCVPTEKVKGKNKYNSFRVTNNLTTTRNDLEPKKKYYWERLCEDRRALRSDFLTEYNYVDLGDMSANFPNLINCIRTGKYTDEDFHTKIAEENGISRSVAKMTAVRCCFNATKVNILQGLLNSVDLSLISNELKIMEKSGLLYWKKNNRSETYNLMIQKGHNIEECHNFFMQEAETYKFFRYCADMLTSWDVCHEVYSNDFCPSLLAEYSSAIETSVIREAMKHGVIIANAYDHAYCLNSKKYDWKGEYKKWAEKLLPCLLEAMEKDRSHEKVPMKKSMVSIAGLRNKNTVKTEVRDFLKTHNYDVDLAQKEFNWDRKVKAYWKRLVKEGKI